MDGGCLVGILVVQRVDQRPIGQRRQHGGGLFLTAQDRAPSPAPVSYTHLQELTDHGGGLHAIVALTAKLAGSDVLLLDHNGRVVAGAGMEGSAYPASYTHLSTSLAGRPFHRGDWTEGKCKSTA